jgi:hypothetical protein
MLLATGGLIAAVLISSEINGYAQVPPMQSHLTQKQASGNNDLTTPFSLPSIRLDNPSNITTLKNGPVAIAGPDQIVKEGMTVILNGSGSRDSNGVILSYSWRQIPTNNFITLSGASTPVWSFTAPTVSADTTLKFQLTVTDSNGLNDNSTVNVLVKNIPAQTPSAAIPPTGNAVPSNITANSNIAANGFLTANTGSDRTVQEGTLVTLDGTNSTGSITSYSWKQTGGKSVKLTNPDTARSTFIAPDVKKDSILKFRLSVDDNKEKKATSTVNILVVDNNNNDK